MYLNLFRFSMNFVLKEHKYIKKQKLRMRNKKALDNKLNYIRKGFYSSIFSNNFQSHRQQFQLNLIYFFL